jgi:hypothetical protein
MQGSGSRLEPARGVCGGSSQNRWVTLLSHKNKTRVSAGGDGIQARREASMSGTRDGIAGLTSVGLGLRRRRGDPMKNTNT